jgi:outer membrane protein OmpA-like peptidoglycan-associated protein
MSLSRTFWIFRFCIAVATGLALSTIVRGDDPIDDPGATAQIATSHPPGDPPAIVPQVSPLTPPAPAVLPDAADVLRGEIVSLQAQLADANDKNAMWQTLVTQQDTLLDIFSTALPDLPVYRQGVYVVICLPEARFDFSSSHMPEDSRRKLELIARIFSRYNQVFYLGVEGHTDNVPVRPGGRYDSNLSLGVARAKMAYQTLLESGVSAGKMAVISWGDSLPMVPHDHEQADPANRRVELVFAPQRAIEHPEPVASLLTPEVRERLKEYAEAFTEIRVRLNPVLQVEPPPTQTAVQTAYAPGR